MVLGATFHNNHEGAFMDEEASPFPSKEVPRVCFARQIAYLLCVQARYLNIGGKLWSVQTVKTLRLPL